MERTTYKTPINEHGLPNIVIPAEVLFHPDLKPNEKILFGIINNMVYNQHGYCWASNMYLARMLDIKSNTISGMLSSLQKEHFLIMEYETRYDGRQVRKIFVDQSYPTRYSETLKKQFKRMKASQSIIKKQIPPLDKNPTPLLKKSKRGIINIIDPYDKSLSNIDNDIDNDIDNKKKDFSDSDWIIDLFPKEWKNDKSFQESIKDFIQHRKEKGSKLTKVAASRLAKKLTNHPIQIATQALELSMENGWQGVFPESVSKGSANKSSRSKIGTRNMECHDKESTFSTGEVQE